ncbi:hypothetical protein [Niveispirillum sp. BGYR6]|uniref:hypothetical protein n=1 Tax=Niveispirillum sp. BGYR6 TaxID=2971249 RepID=UPI0022B945A2|nr:hypothetical protein [Niveispirillum sp. BGYR6]MDG5495718.1 hypothetical protein [Niveispirillum sp. BGYR6]
MPGDMHQCGLTEIGPKQVAKGPGIRTAERFLRLQGSMGKCPEMLTKLEMHQKLFDFNHKNFQIAPEIGLSNAEIFQKTHPDPTGKNGLTNGFYYINGISYCHVGLGRGTI